MLAILRKAGEGEGAGQCGIVGASTAGATTSAAATAATAAAAAS